MATKNINKRKNKQELNNVKMELLSKRAMGPKPPCHNVPTHNKPMLPTQPSNLPLDEVLGYV